jgi:hypothetical protein
MRTSFLLSVLPVAALVAGPAMAATSPAAPNGATTQFRPPPVVVLHRAPVPDPPARAAFAEESGSFEVYRLSPNLVPVTTQQIDVDVLHLDGPKASVAGSRFEVFVIVGRAEEDASARQLNQTAAVSWPGAIMSARVLIRRCAMAYFSWRQAASALKGTVALLTFACMLAIPSLPVYSSNRRIDALKKEQS